MPELHDITLTPAALLYIVVLAALAFAFGILLGMWITGMGITNV